jgi:hypothetical protein
MSKHLVSDAAATNAGLRKSQLSAARQRLVELLGSVHFGRLESLRVHGSEPVFDPPPRVIRTLKIPGNNQPRPQAEATDFALKASVIELLNHLNRIGDGVIDRIEVAHGLPLLLEISEDARAA